MTHDTDPRSAPLRAVAGSRLFFAYVVQEAVGFDGADGWVEGVITARVIPAGLPTTVEVTTAAGDVYTVQERDLMPLGRAL